MSDSMRTLQGKAPVPSYVHGNSGDPLIGDTLGTFLDTTVARIGEREALVVRHQHVRWTWRELLARVNNLAASLMRLGLPPANESASGRRTTPSGCSLSCDGESGIDPGQHQSCLSRDELAYALNKVACRALILSSNFKQQRLHWRCCRSWRRSCATCPPGELAAAGCRRSKS